ncbi:MAG: hypothetical protein CMC88_04125 [Flavobacteriaceae bacterium]|nr:hypothetical protein [Flavobacteriaceae bacterium]|tara:strand:- start:78673 stop:79506 length:834 start_codon:yes stop_codon:yes gene_type:complete
MKKLNKNYLGWNSKDHLISFNFWNDLSNYEFNFRWGSFRENQIISEVLKKGDSLFEVGCATGTTVRWLKNTGILSKIKYLGVDISDTAISKANFLHPKVNFKKIGLGPLKEYYNKFDYVFSRDTIMHQEKPFEFLWELIKCANKGLIIRLRTRDSGITNYNLESNCQLHYDNYWMPYIVINISEIIDFLKSLKIIYSIEINRSYEVLGGSTNRYLPKDLYFKSAGGAETSIFLKIDKTKTSNDIEIIKTDLVEGRKLIRFSIFKRFIIAVLKKLKLL